MGCCNEICAISGLPIDGGDECYQISFEKGGDTNRILAFSELDNPDRILNIIHSIDFGIYDEYGGLKHKPVTNDTPNPCTFILKSFWDWAINQQLNFYYDIWIKDAEKSSIAAQEFLDVLEEVTSVAQEERYERLKQFGGFQYRDLFNNGERFGGFGKEFIRIWFVMASLRKSFYTGAYRGSQSDIENWSKMNSLSQTIQTYISSKYSADELQNYANSNSG